MRVHKGGRRIRMVMEGMGVAFCYCLVSAFARVYIGDFLQQQDPFSFCFYTFTLGALAFMACHLPKLLALKRKAKPELKNIFWLNVTTMGSWLFLTYPLKFMEPAIVSLITFGVGPIGSLLLAKRFYQPNDRPFLDYLISVGLLMTIGYVMMLCIKGETAVSSASLKQTLLALLCCVIVGFSVVVNAFQTKKLINQNFSPLDILCLRFFLLILVAGAIVVLQHPSASWFRPFLDPKIQLASVVFVMLPLLLIQLAQRKLEPITIAIILPFLPILTYFFEMNDHRLHVVNTTLYAIVVVLGLILLGTYVRYKKEGKTHCPAVYPRDRGQGSEDSSQKE